MNFAKSLCFVAVLLVASQAQAQHRPNCTWINGVRVCEAPAAPVSEEVIVSEVSDEELFAAQPGDVLASGAVVVSVTEHTATSYASARRAPVRRVGAAVVRAPFKVLRAGAQQVRKGVARRSARRAARASRRASRVSARFNAVRSR